MYVQHAHFSFDTFGWYYLGYSGPLWCLQFLFYIIFQCPAHFRSTCLDEGGHICPPLHGKLERFFGKPKLVFWHVPRDENCKSFLWRLNPKWFYQKSPIVGRPRFSRPFVKPIFDHWSLFNHPEKGRFNDVFRGSEQSWKVGLEWVNSHILQPCALSFVCRECLWGL